MDTKQFKEYCLKGICLRKTFKSKRCKFESKQQQCYQQFIKNQINKKYDIDDKWEQVKKEVHKRDNNRCRVLKILSVKEYGLIKDQIKSSNEILDVCHVISRAQGPQEELYYNSNNLFLAHRLFHSRLDQYKDLITNKSISKEERNTWIIRIIGNDCWNNLNKLYGELNE